MFCALIFELYHKNTIDNLNIVQKDKFKQQHILIITPKLEEDILDYRKYLNTEINLFFLLFKKNLLNKKVFKEHYYKNKEIDSKVYFTIDIDDNGIYFNFFSNSYNQKQSFFLAKQIKEYISKDILNLIIQDVDKLNIFIKEKNHNQKLD